ncbi:hypothetical protein TNCV_409571 [Trichonephila clavipes]|nr:hypothetical protein TNCV_409571 [Trichonephila clavipes]
MLIYIQAICDNGRPSIGLGTYYPTPSLLILSKGGIRSSWKFAMREKGGNRLVPGPDYMVDALKFPNQAPRVSGESLQMCVAWRCPDGTQHIFCWPILAISGQSLA